MNGIVFSDNTLKQLARETVTVIKIICIRLNKTI